MQWLMLQQNEPEDFVIATGEQHSVREFLELAADEVGMPIEWDGKGVDQKGYDSQGRVIVKIDPTYFRPTEVDSLVGEATKARDKLGWKPKISFRELVAEMVSSDLDAAERVRLVKENGYPVYDYQEQP